jgi:hypothetical protein
VAISYRVNLGRAPASESTRDWRVNDCTLLPSANTSACDGLWQGTIFFTLLDTDNAADGKRATVPRSGNETSVRVGQHEKFFAAQNLTECEGEQRSFFGRSIGCCSNKEHSNKEHSIARRAGHRRAGGHGKHGLDR